MEILSVYGVPKNIVDAVSILYKDTVAQVIAPDEETDLFETAAGVLQGDTLALHLPIVALDYALRDATNNTSTGFMLEKREGSRKPAVYITDAGFANDLALISNYMEQAQRYFYQDWKWLVDGRQQKRHESSNRVGMESAKQVRQDLEIKTEKQT